jgi:3-dehydroquinate dehydratase II
MSRLIYILNGPNLNLLGKREPHIYGYETLKDVEDQCAALAKTLNLTIKFMQTNHEGVLCDVIQEAREVAGGIIINPAGYTNNSIAILDSLLACPFPVMEVHISNIHKREEFRHMSFISKAAVGVICGMGTHGYSLALMHLAKLIDAKK